MTLEEGTFQVRDARTTPLHILIGDDEMPNLGHLTRDLWKALEDGTFEVETPRVHAEQTTFDALEVNKTSGPKEIGQLACQPGPPMLEISLDWADETSDLYEDLDAHMNRECAIALYGDMHVWNVEKPIDGSIEATFDVEGGERRFLCDVTLGWREFAVAGWR
jgi:hypothetical protein